MSIPGPATCTKHLTSSQVFLCLTVEDRFGAVYCGVNGMKIISLNTWGGGLTSELVQFFIEQHEVDVFCLQEVYRSAEGKETPHSTRNLELVLFEKIAATLSDSHVGYFQPAWQDYYGQAMFVKKHLSVLEEGAVLIYENNTPERRGRHSQKMQYVRTEYGGSSLVIANVHGLWTGEGKGDTADRLRQGEIIRDFIQGRSEPVVLVGDFNLNPDTKSLAVAATGLRNLVVEYGVRSTRTRYYEKDETLFADYAFISPQVPLNDFKVLPDVVSDHAPLFLELR